MEKGPQDCSCQWDEAQLGRCEECSDLKRAGLLMSAELADVYQVRKFTRLLPSVSQWARPRQNGVPEPLCPGRGHLNMGHTINRLDRGHRWLLASSEKCVQRKPGPLGLGKA